MSSFKDLKNIAENNFNIIELFRLFIPVKKSKYTELLYKLMKDRAQLSRQEFCNVREYMISNFGMTTEDFEGVSPYQLMIMSKVATAFFSDEEWKEFTKFCEFNERGLVDKNDLTSYKTFSEVTESVKIAQTKLDIKEMEKHVKKIYEDNDWFIIRPLTYLSALKYGYGTKWCTSTEGNSSYFEQYSRDGILMYVISNKTNCKVGVFKSLKSSSKEFSFWDVKDQRVDSMDSGLPTHILEAIRKEIKEYPKSNQDVQRELSIPRTANNEEITQRMIEAARRLSEIRREGRELGSGGIGVFRVEDTIPLQGLQPTFGVEHVRRRAIERPTLEPEDSDMIDMAVANSQIFGRNIEDILPSMPNKYVIGVDVANDTYQQILVTDRLPITNDNGSIENVAGGIAHELVFENPASIEINADGRPAPSQVYINEMKKFKEP